MGPAAARRTFNPGSALLGLPSKRVEEARTIEYLQQERPAPPRQTPSLAAGADPRVPPPPRHRADWARDA